MPSASCCVRRWTVRFPELKSPVFDSHHSELQSAGRVPVLLWTDSELWGIYGLRFTSGV